MNDLILIHDSDCPGCTRLAKQMKSLEELGSIRHMGASDSRVASLGLGSDVAPCLVEVRQGVAIKVWREWSMRLKFARMLGPGRWLEGLRLFETELSVSSERGGRLLNRRTVLGGIAARSSEGSWPHRMRMLHRGIL